MTEHMTDERISDERLAELLEDHEFFHAEVTADQRDAHRQFHWADIPLALRELQARRAAEAWRPIETHPDDEEVEVTNGSHLWLAVWSRTSRQWSTYAGPLLARLTHWRPKRTLPEPPR